MNPALIVVGAIVAVGAALYARTARADDARGEEEMETNTLDAIFAKHGAAFGLDPMLLKAIALRESSLNPDAVRWNPPHDVSVGLMQVLYLPSDVNDTRSRPRNHFDVRGWESATFEKLKDPDFNVYIAAQILAWNVRTFGMPRGLAVYNSWSERNSPLDGPFKNQKYVDGVLRAYRVLTSGV